MYIFMVNLLFFFGLALCFAAYIWFLVIVFKEDLLWGFACLLVQPVALIFLILHWHKCKRPFLTSFAGVLISLIGMLLRPVFMVNL
ncbi:hypothetical protein ES703_38372 [subsurface metagenome]